MWVPVPVLLVVLVLVLVLTVVLVLLLLWCCAAVLLVVITMHMPHDLHHEFYILMLLPVTIMICVILHAVVVTSSNPQIQADAAGLVLLSVRTGL